MSPVSLVSETQARGKVKKIFTEIKREFALPFVPNLFRAMANDPAYLESNWNRFKLVMLSGSLDRKTKELLAVAVSTANDCEYCINAHTWMLKQLGVSNAEIAEGLAVVALLTDLNRFVEGRPIQSDLNKV